MHSSLARRSVIAGIVALLSLLALALPAAADGHARIHLLHGIPDVEVDVEIGGEAAIEGFAFGDTQDLSALAGQTLSDVLVKVAGTDTVAIDAGDLALPAEGNFTAIAHLDAEGTPSLAVFANDESTIAAGSGRLVVRHAAAAPSVDVLANGDVAFADLPNGEEASADLPADTYSASVVPTGESSPVVIGPADLPVVDGTSLIVYAVGSLSDETLTVLTESISGLGSAPARVETGNSPVESGDNGLTLAGFAIALATIAGFAFTRRSDITS